ncbi:unnamed protein product [Scytosiphon promiscuus]
MSCKSEARHGGRPADNNDRDKNSSSDDATCTGIESVRRKSQDLGATAQARVELESVFSALYPAELPEENGMKASRNERLSKGYESVTLTYGEVSATGFAEILDKIGASHGGLPEKDGVFYDLGCGTGKPVFAAAAMHPWSRCIGMEILGDLHGICLKALKRWQGGLKNEVTIGGVRGGTAEIEFVCGDFTVLDWSDGDVVFANSTCFGDDLMKKLAQGATALKEGAIVVTMTDPVPSPAFEVLEETVMGQAGRCATTCYIQRRKAKPLPVFTPA